MADNERPLWAVGGLLIGGMVCIACFSFLSWSAIVLTGATLAALGVSASHAIAGAVAAGTATIIWQNRRTTRV